HRQPRGGRPARRTRARQRSRRHRTLRRPARLEGRVLVEAPDSQARDPRPRPRRIATAGYIDAFLPTAGRARRAESSVDRLRIRLTLELRLHTILPADTRVAGACRGRTWIARAPTDPP